MDAVLARAQAYTWFGVQEHLFCYLLCYLNLDGHGEIKVGWTSCIPICGMFALHIAMECNLADEEDAHPG